MHTTCSDGHDRYEEMAEKALERGLDFIAITDHVGIAERNCHSEYNLKCEAETRLLCFPGAEMTARLHLLAIGIHQRIDPQLPLDVWVRDIHRQGGLAIAAHPYDKRWKYTQDELLHSDLDAMECARGTAEENRQQLVLSDQYHIPCVYNSDAHYQQDVGWRYNECSVPINSLANLKAALQSNKCKMGQ
jgi:predicted metal-dependent phosphoesterase TrpH